MSDSSVSRPRRRVQYETTPVGPIVDASLTLQAKGLWAYLWTRPDDWTIYLRQLSTVSANGRDATRAAFRELVAAGYVRESQHRTKRGRFGSISYELVDLFVEDAVRINPPRELGKAKKTRAATTDETSNGRSKMSHGTANGLPGDGLPGDGKPATTQDGLLPNTDLNPLPSEDADSTSSTPAADRPGLDVEGSTAGAADEEPLVTVAEADELWRSFVDGLARNAADVDERRGNVQAAIRASAKKLARASGVAIDPPTFAQAHALLRDVRVAHRDRYGKGKTAPSPAAALVELFATLCQDRRRELLAGAGLPGEAEDMFELAKPHAATWRAYAADALDGPPLDAVLSYFARTGGARGMPTVAAKRLGGKFHTRNAATGWKINGDRIADWRPLADRWIDVELTSTPEAGAA